MTDRDRLLALTDDYCVLTFALLREQRKVQRLEADLRGASVERDHWQEKAYAATLEAQALVEFIGVLGTPSGAH
jgi:hypothetical protein